MALLWVLAVAPDAGPPPRSVIDQTWDDYTKAGHEDEPGVHDHYPASMGRPMETSRPDQGWTHLRCPGHGEDTCIHRPTRDAIHEIAQQNWNLENHQLFDPEGYQKDREDDRHRMDSFLSDYTLEHPDRVHRIGPDGEELPSDDPRLTGR